MGCVEGSGVPVLYIGRRVPKCQTTQFNLARMGPFNAWFQVSVPKWKINVFFRVLMQLSVA
jgi:hypothetical protein